MLNVRTPLMTRLLPPEAVCESNSTCGAPDCCMVPVSSQEGLRQCTQLVAIDVIISLPLFRQKFEPGAQERGSWAGLQIHTRNQSAPYFVQCRCKILIDGSTCSMHGGVKLPYQKFRPPTLSISWTHHWNHFVFCIWSHTHTHIQHTHTHHILSLSFSLSLSLSLSLQPLCLRRTIPRLHLRIVQICTKSGRRKFSFICLNIKLVFGRKQETIRDSQSLWCCTPSCMSQTAVHKSNSCCSCNIGHSAATNTAEHLGMPEVFMNTWTWLMCSGMPQNALENLAMLQAWILWLLKKFYLRCSRMCNGMPHAFCSAMLCHTSDILKHSGPSQDTLCVLENTWGIPEDLKMLELFCNASE